MYVPGIRREKGPKNDEDFAGAVTGRVAVEDKYFSRP